MKIIFAGTPQFSVPPLEALIAEHEVVAVFTQPDRKSGRGKKLTMPAVKETALAHNIPVFQPTSLSGQASLIEEFSADVIVVVAYGMLLPQTILDIPPLGCINIHASILPRWRGAAPIQRAIEAGDRQTGVSIMQMEAGLDTGPVYQVFSINIEVQDNAASMHDKLSILGAEGIVSTLVKLVGETPLLAIPQNDDDATYAKKITKADGNIDWSLSAVEIQAQIRAFNPWPICQTFVQSDSDQPPNRIRIWQSSVADSSPSRPDVSNGSVTAVSDAAVSVACGEGHLEIEVLQRDGGKPLSWKEFRNGFPLTVGDQFNASSES